MQNTRKTQFIFILAIIFSYILSNLNTSFAQNATTKYDPNIYEKSTQEKLRLDDIKNTDLTDIDEQKNIKQKEQKSVKTDSGIVFNPDFEFKKVQFEGNTVFSDEELSVYIKDLLGKKIYISEVINAALEISKRYQSEGYVTSFAYLPPQKVVNGTVTIKINESKLANISIQGNKWTKSSYLQKKFISVSDIEEGKIFNVRNMKTSLEELNSKSYLKGQVAIEEGSSQDLTEIVLEVAERPPLNFNVIWDNDGNSLVGRDRAILQLSSENLTGYGDSIYAGSFLANGTVGAIAGYKIPLNSKGTDLQFDYSHSGISLNNRELGDSFVGDKISGHANNYRIKLNQPIYNSLQSKLSANIGFDFIDAITKERAKSTGLSGSDIISNYNLRVLRSGINYKRQDKHGLWTSVMQTSYGLPILGATESDFRDGSHFRTGKFFKLNAEVIRLQRLPRNSFGIFKIASQYASRTLFASEQMQLGGVSSLRGFDPGVALGDSGFNGSVEVRTPVPFLKQVLPDKYKNYTQNVKMAYFYDYGWFNLLHDNDSRPEDNFLQSVGVGLHLKLNRSMSASFDLGVPVGHYGGDNQDVRLHFSLKTDVHKLFLKDPELL